MGERRTRRDVLGWLVAVPSVAATMAACGATSTGAVADAGSGPAPDMAGGDVGPEPVDADRSDATGPDAARSVDAEPARPDAATCEPTRGDARGPFFEPGAPARTALAGPEEPGARLALQGTVRGPDCRPLAGALLDVWQADAEGNYHGAGADYRLRGQLTTGADGRFAFTTIMPGRYPLAGSTRPAHIHFTVSHPGHRPVTTQIYFEGDPFLAPNDPCTVDCDSGDPGRIIPLAETPEGLAGELELVLAR